MRFRNVRGGALVAGVLVGSATIAIALGLAGRNPHVFVGAIVGAGLMGVLIIAWILRSVQELRSKCARLEEARSAAVAAVTDRDDRLALVSHDLRTPLQAILLCTHALAKDTTSESRPQLRILASAVNRIEQMIGTMLAVAHLDAGVFNVRCEPCAVSTILDDPIEQFGPRFAARPVRLDLQYTDLVVMADLERIKEVISNLLENALKLSPRGGRVHVVAKALEREVRFSVLDDGPGVAACDIPHLFERHWKGPDADPRRVGLGLYICKRLVEAHRGEIGARSTAGAGTEIWFTVPRADHAMRLRATSSRWIPSSSADSRAAWPAG